MKKPVIAGVFALLMAASACPASWYNILSPSVITASAAAVEVNGATITASGDEIIIKIDTKKTTLKAFLGYETYDTEVHVDLEWLRGYCVEAAGGQDDSVLEGKKITLKATLDSYSSNIFFEDDLITAIGDGFAGGSDTLQSIVLSPHITSIGKNAFSGCDILQGSKISTELDLSNIEEIGEGAFKSCPKITGVKLNENGLRTIGASAFSSDTALKAVDIPDTVEEIGKAAFKGCSNLQSVDFGGNNKLETIGESTFESCTALAKVHVDGDEMNTFPTSTKSAGKKVFSGCTSLQNFRIPDKFEELSDSSFENCTKLNKFVFGTGVEKSQCEKIGDSVFNGCSALTAIYLPDVNYYIGKSAFSSCTDLEKVEVSDILEIVGGEYAVDNDSTYLITKAGNSTFSGCTKLSLWPRSSHYVKNKVELPETWTVIQPSTFSGCTGITSVDIHPVTNIGTSAFSGCTSLPEIVIPDAVKVIEKTVFSGCTKLKDVVLSYDLKNIKDSAFYECKSLDRLVPSDVDKDNYEHTVYLPSSLAGVEASGFYDCETFQYLNFGLKDNYSNFALLGKSSFAECKSLKGSLLDGTANDTIEMPTGVREIQDGAFTNDVSLQRIYFMGNVTTIGQSAFSGCKDLIEVRTNDTIEQIYKSAFANCESLENMPMTLDGKKPAISQIDKVWNTSFQNCKSLKNVLIPQNVTIIMENAFSGCESMVHVQWEEGSQLAEIRANAFNGCKSLSLFSNESSGELSVFPDSLKSIGDSCFPSAGLLEVKLHKPADGSKLFLGKNLFKDNKLLKKVDMSETYTDNIPDNFCSGCEKLETVILPEEAISGIGTNAFANCTYLHTFGKKDAAEGEFTFPEYMTKVGESAFSNNLCMQIVNFPKETTQIALSMFSIKVNQKDVEEKGYTPLEKIIVDPDNPNYASLDGVLYSKKITELLDYPVYKKDETYILPNTVEVIGESSAAANPFLEEVYLQEDESETSPLTKIGSKAFADDSNLIFVRFGNIDSAKMGSGIFNRSEKTTLYGIPGSTVEKYAKSNKNYVYFVDNDRMATEIFITRSDKDISEENVINDSVKISKKSGSNTVFGCLQKDQYGDISKDTILWSSSDPDIAAIDNKGKLSIKSLGKTTISIRNAAGTVDNSIELTITDKDEVTTSSAASSSSKASSSSSKAANSSSKAASTSSKAANSSSKAASTSSKAANSSSKAASTSSKAANSSSKAASSSSKAANSSSKAASTSSKAADSSSKAETSSEILEISSAAPDTSSEFIPDSSEYVPDDSSSPDDNSSEISNDSSSMPDDDSSRTDDPSSEADIPVKTATDICNIDDSSEEKTATVSPKTDADGNVTAANVNADTFENVSDEDAAECRKLVIEEGITGVDINSITDKFPNLTEIVLPDSINEMSWTEPDSGKPSMKFVCNKDSNGAALALNKGFDVKYADEEEFKKGDANCDGQINVTDIAVTAAHIKGIKPLDEKQKITADVNNDGEINVTDIAIMASHIKGIKPIG